MEKLFYDSDNQLFTTENIRNALIETGAADCKYLFIHSDVMFGRPAEGFKRRVYLETLYQIVTSLGVKELIIPTFTYSFPNHEDYDIANSKTYMGAFNEFIRKKEGRYRTDDPLLSVSVSKGLKPCFDHVSNHSLGEGSALDIVHHMNNVKFLFFGAEMGECFTYVHYVEKMMKVPYRFDMSFEGTVIYPNGIRKERIQMIHTQCEGAVLPLKYNYFEQEMEDRGYLKKERIADKYIACLDEKDAYREIKAHIEKDINYFLAIPFRKEELVHRYTYTTDNGRITHC